MARRGYPREFRAVKPGEAWVGKEPGYPPAVTPSVRQAVPSDSAELARLRWDFRREHGTPASLTFASFLEGFRAFVDDALTQGGPWQAWVAEDGDRLVGCVWLQLVEKIPHPSRDRWERPIAYITNMYIAPDLRNEGLGRRLLDEALDFAAAREVDGAVAWPSERSTSFYERAGFGVAGAPLWLTVAGG